MKIAYCIPSIYNSGGMERVLTMKANYLADIMDWDVTIITTSQNNRPPFYSLSPKIRTVDLGIDYEAMMRLPMIKKIRSRIKAKKEHKKRLTDILLKIKSDITISMFTHEMTFLPKINDGSKKVLELHFSKSFRSLDAKSNNIPLFAQIINRCLDWNDRKHIKDYDSFVVLSHRDAADWGTSYSNICVISNLSTFKDTGGERTDSYRALAVGRLCAQKGFDMLLESWGMLPESLRSEWTLDIVGSGPDQEKLLEIIKEKQLGESVNILPPTKNIKDLYLNHSIFCFPSRYEGFPLSLMEAMSQGAAAIAFDCPCGPSEMIVSGENGALVEPGDITSFSEWLYKLMTDCSMRVSMGRKASQSILDNFSENKIMTKWVNLFENIKNVK